MKLYETHYEEYLNSVNQYNIHPELIHVIDKIHNNSAFDNLIVYGPTGVGKYSQVLKILQPYSSSFLKYDKKIKIQTDKHSFIYKISDIHYEVDMSLLGCNSKILWHEIFLQIVDIISVKSNKMGIILCKYFHNIHNELLEIFYSYIQQYNYPQSIIQLKFILLTEHVSFIPNNILNCCKIISVKRPTKEHYMKIAEMNFNTLPEETPQSIEGDNTSMCANSLPIERVKSDNNTSSSSSSSTHGFLKQITYNKETSMRTNRISKQMIETINISDITNCKELKTFSLIRENGCEVPVDIFNIICNNLIHEMENSNKILFTNFRDAIYDILIYNLEFTDCLWYILSHFIKKGALIGNDISEILEKTHLFLKYYNNNYRPIYHLESILFFIIIRIKN
jgi:hypothetical protein